MTFKPMRKGSSSPPEENAKVTSSKTPFSLTDQIGKDEKGEDGK